MLATTLKTATVTILLGLGVAGAIGTSASAYSIRSQCNGDNCVRLQCSVGDWGWWMLGYGYGCIPIGYFDRNASFSPGSYTPNYRYQPYRYNYDNYGVYGYLNGNRSGTGNPENNQPG